MAAHIRRACVLWAVLVGISAGGLSSAMPAPSNTSFALATNIPSLPASISQNVHDAGTTYEVFYKVTPSASGVLGVFGFGDLVTYRPRVRVYTQTSPGVYTAWIPGLQVTGQNRPVQFPVTSGTEYFLKFTSNGGNPTPAVLLIEAEMAPSSVPPTGSLFINDDSGGFPAAIVSSVNGDDYNVLKFVTAPAGEGGCVLRSSGRILLEDADAGLVRVYDSTLTTLIGSAAIALSGAFDLIRASQALDQFYVGVPNNGGSATVQIVSNAGVAGTSYTFPSVGLTAIAPSNDGSIIYNAGQGGSVSAPIKQFLTASSTQSSDLVAGVSGYIISSMLVLADDSIVALYQNNSAPRDAYAVRYNAVGATLHTYTIEAATSGTSPRLAYAMTDASFWTWTHPDTAPFGISTFREFALAGSTLTTVSYAEFETGSAQSDDTATPIARFGVSQSCPFLIMGAAGGTIDVVKATVPAASTQSFDFTADGGLTPTTFDLLDGETQTFTDVTPGNGYSIAETAVGGWTTSFTVSNGSPPDNIAVASGETVTVTVTNTQTPLDDPTPPPCCSTNETGYSGSGPTGPTGTTPPPAPPLTTPRIVPAGGEAPSYTSCSGGGGRPTTASNPTDAQNMANAKTPLVHMKWTLPDGSIRRYGKLNKNSTGGFTSGNGQFVSSRVLNWGPTRQVLSDRHGSFQANQFTIQLSDYDRALRGILSTTATKYIDGKEVELLIETAANAALSVNPLVIARGIITGYKFNRDLTVDLTVTDPLGYRYSSTSLDRPIPYRVIGPTFPGCAETSVGRAVPIIYGEMSDDYSWSIDPARIPVGIVPVIHVGKANLISAAGIPGSQWEAFVICGHALTCVQSVFASNLAEDGEGSVRMPTSTYGSEFLVPGINVPLYYDIVGTDGVTQRFCLFFATGERATSHITGKVPITLNVFGIEDVGDGSGDTITEIAYQYQHFLQSWVLNNYMSGSWAAVPTFTDGTAKVRTTTFDTVNTTHAARLGATLGYNGAMYIGDQKPAREHNREFMVGGDMRTGVNHQGQVLAITVKDTSPTTGLTTFTAADHVVQDSFEITPQVDEIFNVYTYEYGPEPATNRVSGIAQTIRDTTSVTNHSERIAQALLYRTTRQKPTADDVAGRTLLRSANAPTDVTFTLDLRGVALVLGQLIRITHYQGIGVSGWTSRVLMVTGITTNPDEDDFSTTIEAEDVQGLLDAGALAMQIDSGQIDVSTIA